MEKPLTSRELEALFVRAREAGLAAGNAAIPTPMTVVERSNPLDDTSPVVRRYAPVMDGVCGFAWIVLKPGTGRAARMAKEMFHARSHYRGGVSIWVGDFNQSMTRKAAYAQAFARVLQDAGLRAYAESRMD